MRQILELNEDHIDKYAEITFRSYPYFKDFSKRAKEDYKKHISYLMNSHSDITFYGAFDNGEMVGVMRIFDFKMNLFGKIVETSGVGFLGVDPVHKKRKVALDLMRFYERKYRNKELPIALILPFKNKLYKMMGYGVGTKIDQYRMLTVNIPEYDGEAKLKYITEEKDFKKLLACRKKVVEKTHGMALKLGEEVSTMKDISSTQIVASYDEEDHIDGFVIFEFQNIIKGNFNANNIQIHELIYDNPLALRKLLGFLRNQEDQAQLVIFNTKDEDFHYIFPEPTNDTQNHVDFGHIETNTQAIGIMYKLLCVQGAFEQLHYRNYNNKNLKVRFLIEDDYCGGIEEVIVNFNNGYAETEAEEYDVTMEILHSDFSSLFLGCTSVKGLYGLGLITLDKEEFLDDLDLLFYTPAKPNANIDF